jgi:hypothetical protein
MSSADVLTRLGFTKSRLQYVLLRRPELEPPQIAGTRVWSEEHVEAVRASLEARPLGKYEARKKRKPRKTSSPPLAG